MLLTCSLIQLCFLVRWTYLDLAMHWHKDGGDHISVPRHIQ